MTPPLTQRWTEPSDHSPINTTVPRLIKDELWVAVNPQIRRVYWDTVTDRMNSTWAFLVVRNGRTKEENQNAGVIVVRMTTILHFPHDIIEGYL